MCRVGVYYGEELLRYSFPRGHPFNSRRSEAFWSLMSEKSLVSDQRVIVYGPVKASKSSITSFHSEEYVDFVEKASKIGEGFLDYGDTPAFQGVYEASAHVVGSSLDALRRVMAGEFDHAFSPIGGLHHARRDGAAGFCVFNDVAVVIVVAESTYGLKRILYVDIDAHHGDGVFYEFYNDPKVFIADIHEDGRHLYPGTGHAFERGGGEALGTKVNIPLPPKSDDSVFIEAFTEVEHFAEQIKPELIILQCGADGMRGDPITHLNYTPVSHRYATQKLHGLAHIYSSGRLIALGGGGYDPDLTSKAWMEVLLALLG